MHSNSSTFVSRPATPSLAWERFANAEAGNDTLNNKANEYDREIVASVLPSDVAGLLDSEAATKLGGICVRAEACQKNYRNQRSYSDKLRVLREWDSLAAQALELIEATAATDAGFADLLSTWNDCRREEAEMRGHE